MNKTVGAFALLLVAVLAVLGWPELRAWRKDPVRYKALMGSGVKMDAALLFPEERFDFAYEGSPLIAYLEYEREFVEFDKARVLAMADRVAEEVGWKMLMATGSQDVREAERLMWTWGEEGTHGPTGPGSLPNEQALTIMRWIAEHLIRENLYYGPETLFSRSFDGHKDAVEGGTLRGDGHIDCDQIAHIFLHVGWRLDLDVREVLSPLHRYLEYVGPADVAGTAMVIEPTAFRGTGEAGQATNSPFELGPTFLMFADELERYGHIRAAPRLQQAAGYFTHATDRDIADGNTSEVMVGMVKLWELDTLDAPADDLAVERFERADRIIAELEGRRVGTRSPNLVSNLQLMHWRAFRWALTRQDLDRAARHVEALEALQSSHEELFIRSEPLSRIARARLLQAQGESTLARTELRALWEEYGGERSRGRSARSDAQAEVLMGLVELERGASMADRYERYLGPVLAYERSVHADDARLKEASRLCESVLGPGLALTRCSVR